MWLRFSVFFSFSNEILKVRKPLHVQALILVQSDALDKRAQMFVDSESTKILGQCGLNAFIKSRKIRAAIHIELAFESVKAGIFLDIVAHLDVVECDLRIDAGGFDNHSFLLLQVRDHYREVAVVIRVTWLLLFSLLLLLRLVLWHWLSVSYISLRISLTSLRIGSQQACLQRSF